MRGMLVCLSLQKLFYARIDQRSLFSLWRTVHDINNALTSSHYNMQKFCDRKPIDVLWLAMCRLIIQTYSIGQPYLNWYFCVISIGQAFTEKNSSDKVYVQKVLAPSKQFNPFVGLFLTCVLTFFTQKFRWTKLFSVKKFWRPSKFPTLLSAALMFICFNG